MDPDLVFTTRADDIDGDRVHRWLSEHAYWAIGRTRELHDAAVAGSRNYGLRDRATGEQLAYARVVTDGVLFAWLCDVIVAPEARGRGLGKQLVAAIVAELEPIGLKRLLLTTRDAHGLYAGVGFAPLEDPDDYLVIRG